MYQRRSGRDIPVLIVLAVLVVIASAGGASVSAQEAGALTSGDTIQLHRSFRGTKYVLGNQPEQYAIDPAFNMTLRPSFLDVMARRPNALAEVERARPWLVMGGLASTAFMVGGGVMLFRVLDSSPDDDLASGIVLYMGVPLLAALVAQSRARAHIGRGVDMFNERQREAPARPAVLRIEPRVGLGVEPGTMRRVLRVSLAVRAG